MNNRLYELTKENRELIFSVLFYISGLIIGAFVYKSASSQIDSVFKEILQPFSHNLSLIITSRMFMYFSLWLIIVLFGISVLGFSLINSVPFIIGISSALRICYYYSFSFKGIGYSLLVAVPETALIVSIIVFTVKNSSRLSSNVYSLIKNSDTSLEINLGSYLKIVSIYAVFIALSALINSVLIYFFSGLIKL